MPDETDLVTRLREISKRAAFNTWLGIDVVAAKPGEIEMRLTWRPEFGQYSGFLHAAIIGGLIDTACGFAAATLFDYVLASQFSVRCLRPAVAETFVVLGHVIKPGRQQIFTAAELFNIDDPTKLLAAGDAILVPMTKPGE